MRVSDQASHLICSICTCNHEVFVFYDTYSLVIFFCSSIIFSCVSFLITCLHGGIFTMLASIMNVYKSISIMEQGGFILRLQAQIFMLMVSGSKYNLCMQGNEQKRNESFITLDLYFVVFFLKDLFSPNILLSIVEKILPMISIILILLLIIQLLKIVK